MPRRPSSLQPAGRGIEADHPDTLRMERRAIAAMRKEDRIQAELEECPVRGCLASCASSFDHYDRAEIDYDAMQREEGPGPHPNDWVWG